MAAPGANPYSYFTPTTYWDQQVPGKFQSPQYGLDTTTGSRDAKRMAKALQQNPFAEAEMNYPGVPGFDVAAPFDTNPYKQLISELESKTFGSNVKQQLLGLGSGLAFSAASLPLVAQLRNLDYQLGLQADIQSPTRQAARDTARQQQLESASSSVSDRLRALAAVRQAAASGINVSI